MKSHTNKVKKTLIIPIEVTSRELDSRLSIIIDLLKLNPNWNIFLGIAKPVKQYAREVFQKNYVLFENALNPGKLLEQYSDLNVKVIVIDEEGGIATKYQEKNLPRMGYNNEGFDFIEKFFLWGEHNYNTIIKNHANVNKNKLVITGNPRFDLSRKEYNKFFQHFNSNKNYVLLICAFGTANNIIPVEIENSYYMNSKLQGASRSRQSLSLGAAYQKKLLKKYLIGLENLIIKYPNENFVIRCHPLENKEIYINKFANYSNVLVDTSGPIQEWLQGCKLLIHNGCTTSIEGFFHGLEPICFTPYYDEDHIQYLTYEISDKANNEKELLDIFEKKIQHGYEWSQDDIKAKKKLLRKIIYNVDKENNFSSRYIAQEIENLDVEYSDIIDFKTRLFKSTVQKLRDMKVYLNLQKYLIMKKMNARFKIGIKGLEYCNLKNRIKYLSEEMKIKEKIKIKEIKAGIYKIFI